VGPCRRGRDRERPVATRHSERIRPVGHGFVDEGCQVVVRTEDEGLDPSLARPLDQPCLRRPASAGPRVDEQDRPPGRLDRSPAVPRQTSHDRLILRSGGGTGHSPRGSGYGRRATERSKWILPAFCGLLRGHAQLPSLVLAQTRAQVRNAGIRATM
jgi:hypothetical protein